MNVFENLDGRSRWFETHDYIEVDLSDGGVIFEDQEHFSVYIYSIPGNKQALPLDRSDKISKGTDTLYKYPAQQDDNALKSLTCYPGVRLSERYTAAQSPDRYGLNQPALWQHLAKQTVTFL